MSDERALEVTTILKALKVCPSGKRGPCLVYGPPQDVEAAKNPERPTGGWYLKSENIADPPEGKAWTPLRIGEHPNMKSGITLGKNFSIIVEMPLESGVGKERICPRVLFVVGEKREVAFSACYGTYMLHAMPLEGDRVIVWNREKRYLVFSEHERSTAQRLGPAVRVLPEPYTKMCLSGSDAGRVDLAVVKGRPRFVVDFEYLEEKALFFEAPNHDAQWLPRSFPASYDPDSEYAVYYGVKAGKLVPGMILPYRY